jgi:probable F420-dependent oxidoreductase
VADQAGLIFALQAHPDNSAGWAALAREAELCGFHDLVVADHPGSTAAPFVALAGAAGATRTVRLGTTVANLGTWHPFDLASEVSTLDVVSGGRAVLGIGAGHTPGEWTQVGVPYPTPGGRVANMIEVAEATLALLTGETVTAKGASFELAAAVLGWPTGERRHIPLLVGGNNRRLLRWAGQRADLVEITGLGRTLEDGHHHAVRWSAEDLDQSVEIVGESARGRPRPPILGTLVHVVEVTDDRDKALSDLHHRLTAGMPADGMPTVEDLAEVPYVLVGTEAEMADQLQYQQQRWGFRRYTLRPPLEPLMGVLRAAGVSAVTTTERRSSPGK